MKRPRGKARASTLAEANVRSTRSFARSSDSFAAKAIGRWTHIVLAPGADVEVAMKRLAADPNVELVAHNLWGEGLTTPNDPLFEDQWSLDNTGQTGGTANADIAATNMWSTTHDAGDVVVAIVDSGIDYNHVELDGNMWSNPGETPGNGLDDDANGRIDDVHGWDFVNDDGNPIDDESHGTGVAGIVGAEGNNGVGIAGVAWNVQLMAVKTLFPFWLGGAAGTCDDAAAGILYAVAEGADVINASFGFYPWGAAEGCDELLLDAIEAAKDENVLIVAAAGNGGEDNDTTEVWPATLPLPNVIAVAASDHDDELWVNSDYGSKTVEIAAPGTGITTTLVGGGYFTNGGTSFAAPHVAGVAALAISENPTISYLELKTALTRGMVPVGNPFGSLVIDDSRLDGWRALQTAALLAGTGDNHWACDDEVDNDNDSLTDYPDDLGCVDVFAYPVGKKENPQCKDGIDNDSDGNVDHPADSQCWSRAWDDESAAPTCGLGFELALLIPALAAVRRRLRRRTAA